MDDSILQRTTDDIDDDKDLANELRSQKFLANFLLLGAEKLLMARKSLRLLTFSDFQPHDENEETSSKIKRSEGKYVFQQNKKARGKYKSHVIQSKFRQFDRITPTNENLDTSKFANSRHRKYGYRFPLNITAFLAMLVFKILGFHMSLFLRFFSFPLRALNFWMMLLMFPFESLITRFRNRIISLICNRIKSRMSVMKLVIRFGKAFFCLLYVFLLLVGMLVLGFAVSGVVVRNLAEKPMLRTESLNFDYKKTSPDAIVPITKCLVQNGGLSKGKLSLLENLRRRAIPYNHKLRLSVSLTLPESDYNRKLGIFQVRVESLSVNGEVILGSSYPTMLRFKSQPIRVIESLFKSVPLITGLQSEVQNMKIAVGEFAERQEPTACFRVILEQRAEFQAGSGVPEIYAASLHIVSELPLLKRIVWNWRKTIFVWIGVASFMAEMMVVLLFCRPVILPGQRS